MQRPDLAGDSRWGLLAAREADRAEVDATVAAWTAGYDRADLLRLCEGAQVPAGPVYAIDEIFEDPHYAARENILRMTDPRVGELAVPNLVPRLSETPGAVKWLGPELGAHNEDIYRGMLGLDEAELARLRAAGVV
jgi:crotonobetainyl-CoA:carnitine CoA-transferase CaiB-like acyl-CoA transferase